MVKGVGYAVQVVAVRLEMLVQRCVGVGLRRRPGASECTGVGKEILNVLEDFDLRDDGADEVFEREEWVVVVDGFVGSHAEFVCRRMKIVMFTCFLDGEQDRLGSGRIDVMMGF